VAEAHIYVLFLIAWSFGWFWEWHIEHVFLKLDLILLFFVLSSLSTIFHPLKAISSEFGVLGGFGRKRGWLLYFLQIPAVERLDALSTFLANEGIPIQEW
jgi:hypothetical protein